VNIWQSYKQKKWLSRALSSTFSSVLARCAKNMARAEVAYICLFETASAASYSGNVKWYIHVPAGQCSSTPDSRHSQTVKPCNTALTLEERRDRLGRTDTRPLLCAMNAADFISPDQWLSNSTDRNPADYNTAKRAQNKDRWPRYVIKQTAKETEVICCRLYTTWRWVN